VFVTATLNPDYELEGGHLTGDSAVPGQSLTSVVLNRLRSDLIAGVLPPGQRLKIEDLKQRYQTGATPLREALSQLSADHLVQRLDNRGFRAAPLSREEFAELLTTRCWLEEKALRESMARGTGAWEEAVLVAHHRMSRIPRSRDAGRYIFNPDWEEAHKAFHLSLLAACGSSILVRFCSHLYDQSTRYRNAAASIGEGRRNLAAEHAELCNLVISRDADQAVDCLIRHYRKTGELSLDGK
jgi:DNA-binding GntR family transcriptional regulator